MIFLLYIFQFILGFIGIVILCYVIKRYLQVRYRLPSRTNKLFYPFILIVVSNIILSLYFGSITYINLKKITKELSKKEYNIKEKISVLKRDYEVIAEKNKYIKDIITVLTGLEDFILLCFLFFYLDDAKRLMNVEIRQSGDSAKAENGPSP